MEWEVLVQELDEQQKYLEAVIAASKRQQEAARPGTEFDELLLSKPNILFSWLTATKLIRVCP